MMNNTIKSAADIGCNDDIYISVSRPHTIYPVLYKFDWQSTMFVDAGQEAATVDVDKTGTVWVTWITFMDGSVHYLAPGTTEWVHDTAAGYSNVDLGS